jgi:hypothetical protein
MRLRIAVQEQDRRSAATDHCLHRAARCLKVAGLESGERAAPRRPARGDGGRLSPAHRRLRLVASTALRISRVTASGCDTMDAWEAATSSIWAFHARP